MYICIYVYIYMYSMQGACSEGSWASMTAIYAMTGASSTYSRNNFSTYPTCRMPYLSTSPQITRYYLIVA